MPSAPANHVDSPLRPLPSGADGVAAPAAPADGLLGGRASRLHHRRALSRNSTLNGNGEMAPRDDEARRAVATSSAPEASMKNGSGPSTPTTATQLEPPSQGTPTKKKRRTKKGSQTLSRSSLVGLVPSPSSSGPLVERKKRAKRKSKKQDSMDGVGLQNGTASQEPDLLKPLHVAIADDPQRLWRPTPRFVRFCGRKHHFPVGVTSNLLYSLNSPTSTLKTRLLHSLPPCPRQGPRPLRHQQPRHYPTLPPGQRQ